jgi:hypothetical protein
MVPALRTPAAALPVVPVGEATANPALGSAITSVTKLSSIYTVRIFIIAFFNHISTCYEESLDLSTVEVASRREVRLWNALEDAVMTVKGRDALHIACRMWSHPFPSDIT